MKKLLIVVACAALAGGILLVKHSGRAPAPVQPEGRSPGVENRTTAGLPTLLDLGATKCIPCKMMAPILEELEREYRGTFNVKFIDVWENPGAGEPWRIQSIPTQIFLDAEGRELYRHVGFFAKEDILATWRRFGVKIQ